MDKVSPHIPVLILGGSSNNAAVLRRELERSGVTIVMQHVAAEAFADTLRAFVPDVVLANADAGDVDPAAVLAVARARCPLAAVILVARSLDATRAVASLRAGAEDIVLSEQLNRLAAVIASSLRIREPLRRLSPRQLVVLRLIVQSVPTREIARRLMVSIKTVEAHRSALMKRIGIRDVAGLVRYAVRVGLIETRP